MKPRLIERSEDKSVAEFIPPAFLRKSPKGTKARRGDNSHKLKQNKLKEMDLRHTSCSISPVFVK